MSQALDTTLPASGSLRPGDDRVLPDGLLKKRIWKLALLVTCIMIVLALVGVGLTTTNAAAAPTYWIFLVPIYGVLCVFTAYARSRVGLAPGNLLIVRQILHWLGITLAVVLDFTLKTSGEETGVAAGFNALLLLAVGCFLAGVHLEWLFGVVGLLLAATLIVVVQASAYLWLILVVGGLAVGVILLLIRLIGKIETHREIASTPSATSPADAAAAATATAATTVATTSDPGSAGH